MEHTQIENLNAANITSWQRWHKGQNDTHLTNEVHEACEGTLFSLLMEKSNKLALKCIELQKEVDTLKNMPIKDDSIIKENLELKKERNSLLAKVADLHRVIEKEREKKCEITFKYLNLQYQITQLTKLT